MANKHKGIVYGYFASVAFKYTDYNDKTDTTTEFDFKEGDIFYVGLDTTEKLERHANHLKPSKYDGKEGQVINRVLQDNKDKWTFVDDLGTIEMVVPFEKKLVHVLEAELTRQFKPAVNIYNH